MHTYLSAILCFMLSITLIPANCQNNDNKWELKKDEDGIKIYARGIQNSKLKEVKVETRLDASLKNIVAVLADKENLKNWVFKCSESKILKRVSETETFHYQITDAPWPVEDRDFILNSKIIQNPETKVVDMQATGHPDYISRKHKHVRVPYYQANWNITPSGKNKVDIIYTVTLDPGGNIPHWVVNLGLTDAPINTIRSLKREVASHPEKIAGFIKE